MLGLGDHAALRIEERRRAVAPLLDVRRVGSSDQDGPHLLGDAGQSAGQRPKGLQGRVTLTHLFSNTSVPTPSTTPRHPGLTTHVDSLNSTMAGPSTSEPSPISSRSSTGTSIHSPSKLASRSPVFGCAPGLWLRELGLLDRDRGDEAHVHELDGLVPCGSRSAARARRGSDAPASLASQPPRSTRRTGPRSGGRPCACVQERRGPLADSICANLRSNSSASTSSRGEVGAHVVAADVRDGEAEGGEDAAGARDEDGLHAQLLGEGAGVHPPASPKRGANSWRVQAAFDADDPSARVTLVSHATRTGDVHRTLPRGSRRARRGPSPRVHAAAPPHRQGRAVGEVAEEEVGVGHRGSSPPMS